VSLANLSTYVARAGRLARPELDTPAIGIAHPPEALILETAKRCYEASVAFHDRRTYTSSYGRPTPPPTPWEKRDGLMHAHWTAIARAALSPE
jgi:hypothetical protein